MRVKAHRGGNRSSGRAGKGGGKGPGGRAGVVVNIGSRGDGGVKGED